jgi:catechol 2,3-dioxygenase-like lactoylglutathione lyase family enzyme
MLEVSQVLLPVQDIDASLKFYTEVLELPLGFRDGDRYATVKAGGIKLALAAPPERPAASRCPRWSRAATSAPSRSRTPTATVCCSTNRSKYLTTG